MRWTDEELKRHLAKRADARAVRQTQRPRKYRNQKIAVTFRQPEDVGGEDCIAYTFDSRKEAKRYQDLAMLRTAGTISDLRLQVPFGLFVLGPGAMAITVGTWTADFVYLCAAREIVEDVKSPATRTEAYRLRKKIVEACHGITIIEV
jgi:hypothetical protein